MDEQFVRHMGHRMAEDCRKMETTMGYDSEDDETDLDRVPESSRIPQRLNRLLSRAANIEYVSSVILTAKNRLESQIENLPGESCLIVCEELREQLVYIQESLGHISSLTKRSKNLTQAMVQTVRVNHQR